AATPGSSTSGASGSEVCDGLTHACCHFLNAPPARVRLTRSAYPRPGNSVTRKRSVRAASQGTSFRIRTTRCWARRARRDAHDEEGTKDGFAGIRTHAEQPLLGDAHVPAKSGVRRAGECDGRVVRPSRRR